MSARVLGRRFQMLLALAGVALMAGQAVALAVGAIQGGPSVPGVRSDDVWLSAPQALGALVTVGVFIYGGARMVARVERVEERLGRLEEDVRRLSADVEALNERIAELLGRLRAQDETPRPSGRMSGERGRGDVPARGVGG